MGAIDWAAMVEYSDWANGALLDAAAGLSDEQLDRDAGIGPGTVRRILLHTYNGEHVWLERWKGGVETKWPSEAERVTIAELRARFEKNAEAREAFLSGLDDAALARVQPYRDSKGSPFKARLSDMILQGLVHSIHHRAQAVNAIKRAGGPFVELDYMMRIRQA